MQPSLTIYFARDGQQTGSFSWEDARTRVRSGEIEPTDHYWHEGMVEWKLVSESNLVRPAAARPPRPRDVRYWTESDRGKARTRCPHCSELVRSNVPWCPHCRHVIFNSDKRTDAILAAIVAVGLLLLSYYLLRVFT